MIAMQALGNLQDFPQVFTQRGMIAVALGLAHGVTHQVLDQDGLFAVRLVLRRVRLKIKTDGVSRRRFKLRKEANFFTRNHFAIISFYGWAADQATRE